jgi:predicted nucleic acid-binding protein
LDTGPLVAYLDRNDTFYEWSREMWKDIESPLLTCEAVISEACFLLSGIHGGARGVFELLNRRIVDAPFRLADDVASVGRLLQKYSNVPMSVADACLVRMAEQRQDSALLTLDSDFRLYRKHGRQVIPLLTPELPPPRRRRGDRGPLRGGDARSGP